MDPVATNAWPGQPGGVLLLGQPFSSAVFGVAVLLFPGYGNSIVDNE